jgi:enolase
VPPFRPITIQDIRGRLVLDSHLAWTPEFEVELADGRSGIGSAPRGETLSIYESAGAAGWDAIERDARTLIGDSHDQATFDAAVERIGSAWGAQATLALSVAFQQAARDRHAGGTVPRLLLNVLNGGAHAYTNPVRADVPELMLYARSHDLVATIDAYRAFLDVVRAELATYPIRDVAGNPVHDLGDPPTERAIELLRRLVDREGLARTFGIALDASAGDWWDGRAYRLPIEGRHDAPDTLGAWWLSLIERYGIELLEDPFAEVDRTAWAALHAARPATCALLGDNYTSTSVAELVDAGKAADIDAVVAKPNQNGTVSGTVAFANAARDAGLELIVSHRSVETESTFLVDLAIDVAADGLKIGPFRDFTAVIKANELLRRSRA